MKQTKHSSYKPFTIQQVKMDEYSGGEDCYLILDGHGNFYAKTYSSYDAKLIAAAPELLEVCKQAIEVLNGEIQLKKEFHDDEEYIKPLEMAVLNIGEAIAKAEGK